MSETTAKARIVVVGDYYLPGYKSGGGMRTIVNMVERLGDSFEFFIVTRDHDGPFDLEPYPNIEHGVWQKQGKAMVYYLSRSEISIRKIKSLLEDVSPKAIYTNSVFSTLNIYVLLLRKLTDFGRVPQVLAPCGELQAGALGLKKFKKKVFLFAARAFGLYSKLLWKATNDEESGEIERIFGNDSNVMIAPDLAPSTIYPEFEIALKPEKTQGAVKLAFLSRFDRKKNLGFVLPIISRTRGKIELDVFGPLQDEEYWKECLLMGEQFPEGKLLTYKGTVENSLVPETLCGYHFFICPTLGENFGHVFLEALAAGCPLIISDRTPWQELRAKNVGWDIALENDTNWESALDEAVSMSANEYERMSADSRKFAEEWLSSGSHTEKTIAVLNKAVGNS
ncbi:MAG: glycosyltransferase [Pyrinomonadaceae bacterium]